MSERSDISLSERSRVSGIIRRHPGNPILKSDDVPFDSDLVFNAGVVKYQGRYVMLFRNDYGYEAGRGFKGTNLGLAFSEDGVEWDVSQRPILSGEWLREQSGGDDVMRIYDPRLTVIDGRCYLCFAADTHHGIRGGIAVTEDFDEFRLISLSLPDNRNMVLFPERIGGRYFRLERPFPVYGRWGANRFDIWIGCSPDLNYWGDFRLLLGVEDVPFSNEKIGPAAPPVRTSKGWLTTFHAVMNDGERRNDPARMKNGWEDAWTKVYYAGIMLLDPDDPTRVAGICREPLIAPEAQYEREGGFRNDVIFPGGMILEDDGEVKIYYGATDTVECLATAYVDDLVALCLGN